MFSLQRTFTFNFSWERHIFQDQTTFLYWLKIVVGLGRLLGVFGDAANNFYMLYKRRVIQIQFFSPPPPSFWSWYPMLVIELRVTQPFWNLGIFLNKNPFQSILSLFLLSSFLLMFNFAVIAILKSQFVLCKLIGICWLPQVNICHWDMFFLLTCASRLQSHY